MLAHSPVWRALVARNIRIDGPRSMQFNVQFRSSAPTIVHAHEDDAAALAAVHRAAFPVEGEHWGEKAFRDLLRQKTVFCLKAIQHGRVGAAAQPPHGFVLVREVAGDAEILTVAVHPNKQGHSLGRLLMEEALRELYARRAVSLYLEVAADNVAALRLYRRLGFDEIGRRDGYYARSGRDQAVAALTMRLDL